MRKISSNLTIISKKTIPFILSVFFAIILIICLLDMINSGKVKFKNIIELLFTAIGGYLMGYLIMRNLVFDLVDEVWDDGDSLVVKNKNKELRIPLGNIRDIRYSPLSRPSRVTLSLREKCEFGYEVTFMPREIFLPNFRKNKEIEDLIDRVGKSRNG